MLKPLVSKFRHDVLVHLKDTAEKRVPAKRKLIGVTLLLMAVTCVTRSFQYFKARTLSVAWRK